ncbi:MAG TPA: TlpA disulfide reductase family protein [Bacteroidia bacterium]|nr:TlpA disulfide reductase family protein [Bacteroidia bacterium]
MKNNAFFFLFIATVFFFLACEGTKKQTGNAALYGQLQNSGGDTLFLYDISLSEFKLIDSTITNSDGTFEFDPLLAYKGFYNVSVGKSGQQFATVVLGVGDSVQLTGDAKNLGYTWKTSGSKDAERFNEFNNYITLHQKKRAPYVERLDSALEVFQTMISMLHANDSVKRDSLDKVYGDYYTYHNNVILGIDSQAVKFVQAFIDRDPGSFANIPALRLLSPFDYFPWYERTALALEARYKSAPQVKLLREMIERYRPFAKGQVPPDIALTDPNGEVRKLSSLKGKIVLLDFWASWCKPCIVELPGVVSNYNKYQAKGFDVFSVSLDQSKQDWIAAIKKNKLRWSNHVIDLQGPNSVAALYGVKTIPKTFLIGRDGRILEREIYGEDLTHKLDQLFLNQLPQNTDKL